MTSGEPRDVGVIVTIVDDHDLVGETLVRVLDEGGFSARRLGVTSTTQLVSAFADDPRGLVLLDLDLGSDGDSRPIDSLDLVRHLRAGDRPVVIVSGSRDPSRIAAAVAAGAAGFVSKATPLPEFMRVIADVAAGKDIMSAAERAHWLELDRRATDLLTRQAERIRRLTSREREVLDLLARGQRVSAIAERFVVSEATVRTHVKSMLKKLEVNSQIEALAIHRAAVRRSA